jgi:hypothetical protein
MTTETELEALKKEVAALKDQLNPPPRPPSTYAPRDYTEGMSMPRSAMQSMIDAVPDHLMTDLRSDARRPNAVTGGATAPSQPVQRGSGWVSPAPLTPPPGIEHCDRMMDEQDRIDRAELALKFAKAELSKGKGYEFPTSVKGDPNVQSHRCNQGGQE